MPKVLAKQDKAAGRWPARVSPLQALTTTAPSLAEAQEHARAQTVASLERSRLRVRNPKGRLRRAKFLVEVELLRMEGFKPKETADVLGCSVRQVVNALKEVRRDSELPLQMDRLDKVGIPLAIDNVLVGLMDGDKEITLRMMDGRGLFRSHKSIDQQVTKRVLEMRVLVTMPPHLEGRELPPMRPGSVVGAPMTMDTVAVMERPAGLPPGRPDLAVGAVPDLT